MLTNISLKPDLGAWQLGSCVGPLFPGRRVVWAVAALTAALTLTWPSTLSAASPDQAEAKDSPVRAESGPETEPDSANVLEAAFQFARAKLLVDEGSFDQAAEAFDRALELDGADPYGRIEVAKFHAYLAQISRSSEKRVDHLRKAAEHSAEARQMAASNSEILQSYAQIHLRLGEHQPSALEQAREAYEQLRSDTTGDLQVLTSLGQIYLWKQEAEKAVDVLEEAASYLPNHRLIQTMLLESLMESGNESKAETVLEKLIEIEPASLEHRMRLAELRSERGDHRAAAAVLSEASDSLQVNPRLRRALARELHLSGANEDALALTDAMLAESTGAPGVARLRVAILAGLTRYEEALAELEPIIAAERDKSRVLQGTLHMSRLLERLGRSEDAVETLRSRIDTYDAAGQLQLKLNLVGVLERDESFDEALELLRSELAAADGAHQPMLARALSELLARLDRTDEAVTVLDETIARWGREGQAEVVESLALQRVTLWAAAEAWQPLADATQELFDASSREVRVAARILHAEALAGLGRLGEALDSLTGEANEIGVPQRLAKRVELLFGGGREDEAAELLSGVIERGERDDLLLASQVYQRVERYGDSVPLLQRLLEEDEASIQLLFMLGAAHERSGDRAEASAAFERLLQISPDHAPTLNYLGYMWAEQGERLDTAVQLILRAVALDPDNGAYVDSLGWAYFQLGRYAEARSHLEWAARLIPDDATIFEHLGDLYRVLDEVDRARDSYQEALDLGGENLDGLRQKLQKLDQEDL
ncbi:MAG: tetratricopeptide repeat protein [Acidobacteriota bacterium]